MVNINETKDFQKRNKSFLSDTEITFGICLCLLVQVRNVLAALMNLRMI